MDVNEAGGLNQAAANAGVPEIPANNAGQPEVLANNAGQPEVPANDAGQPNVVQQGVQVPAKVGQHAEVQYIVVDNQVGNQGVVARYLTPEGLFELRLAALAAELNPGMAAKFPGNLHRQQAELNEKLRAARLQFPIRETAEKEFKGAEEAQEGQEIGSSSERKCQ